METKDNKTETEIVSDEQIVEHYWSREERAILETSEKYGRYLYRIAYNIVNDHMDSEECVNDTYLNTWNSIPPARPTALRIFLSKITRNLSLDRFRRNMADKRIPSELISSLDELDDCLDSGITVEEEYRVERISELLNAYIKNLSVRAEFIFVCRYYYADSIEDIARMLDVSRNTIARELTTIRQGLKDRLEKEELL